MCSLWGSNNPRSLLSHQRLSQSRLCLVWSDFVCDSLGDDLLDSYSLAYTIASLINQLFGKGKEPFWQQAYVNLVRWIIGGCPGRC